MTKAINQHTRMSASSGPVRKTLERRLSRRSADFYKRLGCVSYTRFERVVEREIGGIRWMRSAVVRESL